MELSAVAQESARCFHEERDRKYVWLRGPYSLGLYRHCLLSLCLAEAAIDNIETSEPSCVPIRLYWWTLKSELHVACMYHEIILFF